MSNAIESENKATGLALGTRLFEKWCEQDKEIKAKTGQPPEVRFEKWFSAVKFNHGPSDPELMALISAIVLHNEL